MFYQLTLSPKKFGKLESLENITFGSKPYHKDYLFSKSRETAFDGVFPKFGQTNSSYDFSLALWNSIKQKPEISVEEHFIAAFDAMFASIQDEIKKQNSYEDFLKEKHLHHYTADGALI